MVTWHQAKSASVKMQKDFVAWVMHVPGCGVDPETQGGGGRCFGAGDPGNAAGAVDLSEIGREQQLHLKALWYWWWDC